MTSWKKWWIEEIKLQNKMNKTYKVLVLLDSVVKALGIVFGAVVVAKAGSVKNVRGGGKNC